MDPFSLTPTLSIFSFYVKLHFCLPLQRISSFPPLLNQLVPLPKAFSCCDLQNQLSISRVRAFWIYVHLLSLLWSLMASISDQGFNSNRNYRRWLVETFDGHETADDELSDNINGCDDIIKPCNQNFPSSLEHFDPFVGMEFESAEDAREFYEMYGRRMGFTIRNNRTRRSLKDNSIIGREFVCSKEGFRADKHATRGNRLLPSRPATRGGCNAMLRIGAKDGEKWAVYGFVKEHNHELNPSKMPPRRSHRIAFSEDEKDLKIRELSTELHRERKRSAAYQGQLQMILQYIEDHTRRLSLKVEVVLNNVQELESEEQDSSYSD